jgi:septal ring factor EnvC (AmiA/AmiB activator)
MASHDFQTALQNYLDLEDLRKRLLEWQTSLGAYDDLIAHRQRYYEPLLPEIDREFRRLDAQIRLRLEQREHLDRRLHHLLVAPRPEDLATAEEQQQGARLDALEARLVDASPEEQQRVRRLRGVLRWNLELQYHQRLTEAHRHLRELNRDVEAMQVRYDAFVRTRQAATHSYVGYAAPIEDLRERITAAQERLDDLMKRQGEMLETVASRELERRRDRLETYLNQARFAFADSYDRAAKAQASP